MNICIIGLGSIGIRHLSNLCVVLKERGITSGSGELRIDAIRTRNRPLPPDTENLLTNIYCSAADAPDDYDIIFITNPTVLHYDAINDTIRKTRHMFIEKPVFDKVYPGWQALPWKQNSIYYVACPVRYSSVIAYLKEFIKDKRIYSARCICSSYLPEWRPGTDYRECYSAKAEQGGGVRLDIIHELDYIQHLFGYPVNIAEYHGKYSSLEISSEDLAVYIAGYPDKLVSLHLDYFGRKTRREIEIYTEDDVITGDLANQCVRFLHSGRVVSLPQERNEMQQSEITCFLDMIEGKRENDNTVKQAVFTLSLALGGLPS